MRNNKYILPRAIYHQTLWMIRDYYRMKEKADDVIMASHDHDEVRGGDVPDPTFSIAVKRERYVRLIAIIDDEKRKIPDEYQRGVWESIMYGSRFPDDANRSTYGRWKSRFVYNIAVRLGFY